VGTRYRRSPATVLLLLGAVLSTAAELPAGSRLGARILERFRQLDTNGDGKLSREEGRSLPSFGDMDTDTDGGLTPQEVGTFHGPKGASPIPLSYLSREAIEQDTTPPFSSPDGFKPEDLPVGDPGVSYNDPEFLPGGARMTFVDQRSRRIWVAELDPKTGLTRSETGQDILVGKSWAPFKHSQNGPEWCLDRQGAAVAFTAMAAPTPKTYARTDTSICLFGLGRDSRQRLVRRVDDGGVTGRKDYRYEHESCSGPGEILVYYTVDAPDPGNAARLGAIRSPRPRLPGAGRGGWRGAPAAGEGGGAAASAQVTGRGEADGRELLSRA
jgi:hypothetical protein